MTLAKPLAGGLPIGAVLLTEASVALFATDKVTQCVGNQLLLGWRTSLEGGHRY